LHQLFRNWIPQSDSGAVQSEAGRCIKDEYAGRIKVVFSVE
jgi:hypothetical protein